jgi:acyl-CoA reductase-like NAD-dependent aldehyde dehydrogenase
MIDDLEGKTLEELKELEQQLAHAIDVMDEMRVSQIDSAVNAAGEAAKELTSARHIDIRADINSRFQASLDDLHNRLAACQKRIDRLTQNQDRS